MPAETPLPDLQTLVRLFYENSIELGSFTEVVADDMPAAPRRLLAHHDHMTVTVEEYHGDRVAVEVLETRLEEPYYSRKILLRRERDRQVVQFGIVRLDFRYVDKLVRQEIESQRTPLGRVLIEHDVLRWVELVSLWRIVPGPDLRRLLALPNNEPVYGRTALIYCNGEPAVELLEIVTA